MQIKMTRISIIGKLKTGSLMTITCPQNISVDNKVMNGVDSNDNLRGYYNV